jgi:hypothetical protein
MSFFLGLPLQRFGEALSRMIGAKGKSKSSPWKEARIQRTLG